MSSLTQTRHIPLSGVLLLVLMSFLWGGNMIAIKISNQGIPPIMAAAVRSVFASLFLWMFMRLLGEDPFFPRRHLMHGVAIGSLFGLEFLLLYWGTAYTDASRAIIILYTHPFWVALGAHLLIPEDRLTFAKTAGLILAFFGVVSVFGSRPNVYNANAWVGDLMEIGAGALWAATTIYIKRFVLSTEATHYQTLFAQLFFSIPVLVGGSLLLEWGRPLHFPSQVLISLFYQVVIIATISYVLWFWMIHRYQVSRLAAFTFLAPLFGVLLSWLMLGESLSPLLLLGLSLVAIGIYLVNRPETG
ncbi:DMT family transporter [Desulfomonile tiedjei]|uniref:DMT(Drug/metabolite transporter) superfamily permease n=1 Tax=Desulfomonile tiedjei (strain ATCC 49306 / DSM 6799 / DCB-1) TaxID=706587 RepID=I4C652_DESTA|nr:DMT family transporter [Desulfomonile tiedjei]AFM25043.1 DMT(drug/metabolite transporter) superfamily permease [Desulfomonile tiedjei DSM 6799]